MLYFACFRTMRLLRTIPTPWTPYGVTFSNDGTRLAIGGGHFYGYGGIMVVRLSDGEASLFICASPGNDWPPTVSGMCFSADDRYLAASTWCGRFSFSRPLIFEVADLQLVHRASLGTTGRFGCPTGVLVSNRHVIIRNHNVVEPDDAAISIYESPGGLAMEADLGRQHLTHSGVVVCRGSAITARRLREPGSYYSECLVTTSLDHPQSAQHIRLKSGDRITAIAATPAADGFVTGGIYGDLNRWSWTNRWQHEPIRARVSNSKPRFPGIVWATYGPQSIASLCHLSDGRRLAIVTAGGEIGVMAEHALVSSEPVASPGSPRCLAAHPSSNTIAVGIKQSGWANPKGAVDLLELP